MILLANINRLALAVKALIPHRAHDEWFAFIPEWGSATSPCWDMYPSLYSYWLFPGTEESPDDQPLRDPLSATDHSTLLHLVNPTLCTLFAFLARGKANDSRDADCATHLLNEVIDPRIATFQIVADEFRAGRLSPEVSHRFFNTVRALINFLPSERRNIAWTHGFLPEDPDFANLFLTSTIAIPRGPHEDSLEEPYPTMDMSSFDPIWYWWIEAPTGVSSPRGGHVSSHYLWFWFACGVIFPSLRAYDTSQALSSTRTWSGDTPCADGTFRSCVWRDHSTPHKASVIAASPSNSAEIQVDPPEMSPADAVAIAEVPGRTSSSPWPASYRRSRQAKLLPGCPSRATLFIWRTTYDQTQVVPEVDHAARPKRHTTRRARRRRMTRRRRNRSHLAPRNTNGRFLSHPRARACARERTRGKNKKGELPAYVPPQPVPTMDSVTLATETLANGEGEPTVFNAGYSNCVLRDRECDHGALSSICEHCNKGCSSHCSHTFAVSDHSHAANHLELYTRLSNECGNELITDLFTAHADYKLAHEQLFCASARLAVASNRVSAWIHQVVSSLGPYGLPRMTEIPEAVDNS
ncbi:hypothetical protein B0H14DRAFT_2624321 [Mycena olivaceomarginata]|nr:hypothetical protein B0H14DRAFT_2624321 [Mycena olivaceomarginata]